MARPPCGRGLVVMPAKHAGRHEFGRVIDHPAGIRAEARVIARVIAQEDITSRIRPRGMGEAAENACRSPGMPLIGAMRIAAAVKSARAVARRRGGRP